LEANIEKRELELKKDEYQIFYSEEKKRLISYAEYVLELNEQYKQTIFDIKESTGEGNYSDVEKWSFPQIIDYLKRKKIQIEKLKSKYKDAK